MIMRVLGRVALVAGLALLAAEALAPTAVTAAEERPEVVSVNRRLGEASVVVQLPEAGNGEEIRATTLALPGRRELRPASVSPLWSRETAVAVVLPPRESLGRRDQAAASSLAADLLL
ncbi:MAG: hypothetical protein M3P48_08920, partial [Actinomycetota bacterium]|nr:hypothetical protein [Actinomycetota bacterium]